MQIDGLASYKLFDVEPVKLQDYTVSPIVVEDKQQFKSEETASGALGSLILAWCKQRPFQGEVVRIAGRAP